MIKETIVIILDELSKRIVAGFSSKKNLSNQGIMSIYKELRE